MAETQVTVLYSPLHKLHAPEFEFGHGELLRYAEVPGRIEGMRDLLEREGIVRVAESNATIDTDEIATVHDRGMLRCLDYMSRRAARKGRYLYPHIFQIRSRMSTLASTPGVVYGCYAYDGASPIGECTWKAALSSASLAAMAASYLLEHKPACTYALCRPPGHHAGHDFLGGFCYLNNAALGARRLLKIGNVAIVDIDYHHGNGTQDIFWEEPRVFYGSIHCDPSVEYPYYSGYPDEVGGSHAAGSNLNIPLPPGTTGEQYLHHLESLLQSVQDFGPSTIVVSVGFDTYIDDPLGSFMLTADDYHHIGIRIAQLGLPTLFVQEGGYCLEAQADLAACLLRGFLSG